MVRSENFIWLLYKERKKVEISFLVSHELHYKVINALKKVAISSSN